MFRQSKYTTWYQQIVGRARERTKPEGYCERHHVIPKSIGGTHRRDNLVFLTAREHLLCHYLLSKMMIDAEHILKMKRAFGFMVAKSRNHIGRVRITGRIYSSLREASSQGSALRNPANRFNPATADQAYRDKMSDSLSGREAPWRVGAKDSEETRKRKSESGKKKVFSPEHRAALSAAAKAWRKKAS
jgi:hypothetical protein